VYHIAVDDLLDAIAHRHHVPGTRGVDMFTTYFWKSALERAVKSFAQSLLAILGVAQVGVLDVDWLTALSTAAMAAALSILTSVASARTGATDDPSLVKPDGGPTAPPPQPAPAAA
jgi:hypothetical protein